MSNKLIFSKLKYLLIFTTLVLLGCTATRVSSLSQVLSEDKINQKKCYKHQVVYNLNASAAPTSAAIILFPPLGLLAVGSQMATDMAIQEATKQCGLSTEQAIERAVSMSYIENSPVVWFTQNTPKESIIVSFPLETNIQLPGYKHCKAVEIQTEFGDKPEKSVTKWYKLIANDLVCQNESGEVVITDRSFSEKEYQKLKEQSEQWANNN